MVLGQKHVFEGFFFSQSGMACVTYIRREWVFARALFWDCCLALALQDCGWPSWVPRGELCTGLGLLSRLSTNLVLLGIFGVALTEGREKSQFCFFQQLLAMQPGPG